MISGFQSWYLNGWSGISVRVFQTDPSFWVLTSDHEALFCAYQMGPVAWPSGPGPSWAHPPEASPAFSLRPQNPPTYSTPPHPQAPNANRQEARRAPNIRSTHEWRGREPSRSFVEDALQAVGVVREPAAEPARAPPPERRRLPPPQIRSVPSSSSSPHPPLGA